MDNQQVIIEGEIFKQDEEFPRLLVGNKGTIRCSKTHRVRYTGINAQGYLSLCAKKGGKRHKLKVHRLVAKNHLPPPQQELVEKCAGEHYGVVLVKHLDNNKPNNHVENLEWSDSLGNTQQAWQDGLIEGLRGEANGRAILTEDKVHAMCKAFQEGMMPQEAVQVFGVSRQQASKIRAGIQWKYIWEQYDIKVKRRSKR